MRLNGREVKSDGDFFDDDIYTVDEKEEKTSSTVEDGKNGDDEDYCEE